MGKKCFKCGEVKDLSEYYKHKGMTDGILNKCKKCTKKDVSDNPTDYGENEHGIVRVMYDAQVSNSKARGHDKPSYSKEELRGWLYLNGFKELFNKWIDSGKNKLDKPSCDRLDDYKGYSLSNIRLVTWRENKDKQTEDIILGRSTSGMKCKPCLQFNNDGELINRYVSYSSGKRTVGYSFEKPLKTGKPDKMGYYWKYES